MFKMPQDFVETSYLSIIHIDGYEEVNQYLLINHIWDHPHPFVFRKMFCCLTIFSMTNSIFWYLVEESCHEAQFYGAVGICEPKITTI